MMNAKETVRQASALHKAGNTAEGLKLLQALVKREPDVRAAWWGIAVMSQDPQEQLYAVNEVLRRAPDFEKGQRLKMRLLADTALDNQPQTEQRAQTDTTPPMPVQTQPASPPPKPAAASPTIPTTQSAPSALSLFAGLVMAGGAVPVAVVAYDQLITQGDGLAQVLGIINVLATLVQLFLAVGVFRRTPDAAQNATTFLKGTAGFSVAAILFLHGFLDAGDDIGIDAVQMSLTYWIWLIADGIGLFVLWILREHLEEDEAHRLAHQQAQPLVEAADVARQNVETKVTTAGIQPFLGVNRVIAPYQGERLLDRFSTFFSPDPAGEELLVSLVFTDRRLILLCMGVNLRPVPDREYALWLEGFARDYGLAQVDWQHDGRNTPTDSAYILQVGYLAVPYGALVRSEIDAEGALPERIQHTLRMPDGRTPSLSFRYDFESKKRRSDYKTVRQQHLAMLESLRRGQPVTPPADPQYTVTGRNLKKL